MDWSIILSVAGFSFGALLIWILTNFIFLEKDWGDKITMILVVIVLLGNLVFLSWELILEGYLLVVPGLFIVGAMIVVQIWLFQPVKNDDEEKDQ